ncbi:MAG: large subunit ribosomal protein L5 [bacterium]|nr:MAG: large subunit ribosomal protein L5 [bacterium]
MLPRLKQKYSDQIASLLMKEFGLTNPMAVPRLEKIVINMGLGRDFISSNNAKVLDIAADELAAITGQKPVITRAKKSIAAFKLRQNMTIGAMECCSS